MVPPGQVKSVKFRETEFLQPIPDGAWLEGELIKPIRVGRQFSLRCTCYCGKISICRRVYRSSAVVAIRGDQVITLYVRYKVLRVPRFDPDRSLRAWG